MEHPYSILIVIIFCYTTKASEHLLVTGTDEEISAYVGEEVVLNCSVDSQIPTESLEEVTWMRTDQEILVLLYADGEALPDSSDERYRGRAEFFTTEIPNGNFSLRLTDVRTEDIGEYICKVHTSTLSANTTVILKRLGFSSIQSLVLALCCISLLFSLGLIVGQCKNRGTIKEIKKLQIVVVVFQNIFISVAFMLWGATNDFVEGVTCALVNITRFLLLMKVANFPENMHLCRIIQDFSIPVQHSAISIFLSLVHAAQLHLNIPTCGNVGIVFVTSSIIISLGVVHSVLQNSKRSNHEQALFPHNLLFVCMEISQSFLLAIIIFGYKAQFDNLSAIISAMGMKLVLSITVQRYSANELNYMCSILGLTSVLVFVIVMLDLVMYAIVYSLSGDPKVGWMLLFESVLFSAAWAALICVIYCCKEKCYLWRGPTYIFCAVMTSIIISMYGLLCMYWIQDRHSEKSGGLISETAFIHTLAAISLFGRPQVLPKIPHALVCIFEAYGLTAVNAITLATVLFRKSNGERPAADLRTILLPFECVFLAGWLALQIYDAWKKNIERIKNNFQDPIPSQDDRMSPMVDMDSCPADPAV